MEVPSSVLLDWQFTTKHFTDASKPAVKNFNAPLLCGLLMLLAALPRPAAAVDYSEASIAGKRATVCRVDLRKDKLELFLSDPTGRTYKTFAAIENALQPSHRRLVFAMNAGMYHADYSPVGLFVASGRQLTPLNRAAGTGNFFLKPNGAFVITDSGAQVVATDEYPPLQSRVILASQSGPLLVRNGKIHPAFDPASTSRLFRNGVGILSPNVALFVISEAPVSFYEFSVLFRDVLHCPDALFFDGTVSSLHAAALKRSDKKIDLGPIIGVVE